jgi:hypothetical protein
MVVQDEARRWETLFASRPRGEVATDLASILALSNTTGLISFAGALACLADGAIWVRCLCDAKRRVEAQGENLSPRSDRLPKASLHRGRPKYPAHDGRRCDGGHWSGRSGATEEQAPQKCLASLRDRNPGRSAAGEPPHP